MAFDLDVKPSEDWDSLGFGGAATWVHLCKEFRDSLGVPAAKAVVEDGVVRVRGDLHIFIIFYSRSCFTSRIWGRNIGEGSDNEVRRRNIEE